MADTMVPGAMHEAFGDTVERNYDAAITARAGDLEAIVRFNPANATGTSNAGLALAQSRKEILAARCSEAEERFALTGPLNRAPCAEITMDSIMPAIRESATAKINALHETPVSTAEFQLHVYQGSVKPAQYGLIALGGAVGILGAAWGMGGIGGGGNSSSRTGGSPRRRREGVTIEGEYTVVENGGKAGPAPQAV